MTPQDQTIILQEIARLKPDFERLNTITASTRLWAGPNDASDDAIAALDLDSLDLINFLVWLEDDFGVALPAEEIDLGGWSTIADLFAAIDREREPVPADRERP